MSQGRTLAQTLLLWPRMKTTTFLSLAGIAAAAGTAFALNSSVLDSKESSPLANSVISVAAGSTETISENPITDETVVGQVQASSAGSSVAIPNVGDVIVSGSGTSFQIVEALPKQGWRAEQVMNDGPRPRMHFTNGTARVEVEIVPQADGTARVVAIPDDRPATPGTPSSTTLPGSPAVTIAPLPGTKPSLPGSIRGDDDDDDDDDRDEDHHDVDDDHDEDDD